MSWTILELDRFRAEHVYKTDYFIKQMYNVSSTSLTGILSAVAVHQREAA